MSSSTTTPTAEAPQGPSTEGRRATETRRAGIRDVPQVAVGDIVLVLIDQGVRRPLLVTAVSSSGRVSGTICCEPEDHTRPAFRGWAPGGDDPARISGRPDRLLPLAYGDGLAEGAQVGQWIPRPTRLPGRS